MLLVIVVFFVSLFYLLIKWSRKGEIVGYVSSIRVSPLKSGKVIKLTSAEITLSGVAHDRQYVLLNEHGRFLCTENEKSFVLIYQTLTDEGLVLNADGMEPLTLPLYMKRKDGDHLKDIKIKLLTAQGVHVSDEADQWFEKYFNRACKLYCFPADGEYRYTRDKGWWEASRTNGQDKMMFGNHCPLMLLSESSVDELNDLLETPVHIDCFRPTITFSHCKPHAEDEWKTIAIGDTILKNLYPTIRCPAIEINQETSQHQPKLLQFVKKLRPACLEKFPTFNKGPLFGCNYGVRKPGRITVGDPVYKLS